MRKISSLTLVLSDACNFSCPYCPQQKGKNELRMQDIRDFLDLLRPRLDREVWLGFYGGEPLLSWLLIKAAVAHVEKNFKNEFRFTLTTNGSLLKKEHIGFFRKHRFGLVLSYDGLAQKYRDARRLAAVEAALKDLRQSYPHGYVINSVFTPKTVPLLAASMEKMLKQGHRRLQYSLDLCVAWKKADLAALEKQLAGLAAIGRRTGQKNGKMPLENFRKDKAQGTFACYAGRDRLALLPDRTVWGCYLFYDLLGHERQNPDYEKYCLGALDDFAAAPARALARAAASYSELRQDYFFTVKKELCGLCDDLERCAVCPAVAMAVIPGWTCRVAKITRAAVAGRRPAAGS